VTKAVEQYRELAERLVSWAQNEEMIDQHFLEHGKDCLKAAEICRVCADMVEGLNIPAAIYGGLL